MAIKEPVVIQCTDELLVYSELRWMQDEQGNTKAMRVLTHDVLIRAEVCQSSVVEIAIPSGYPWDGATIPRPCWAIIGHPIDPQFALASLAHDWFCEHSATRPIRVMGDAVFLWLLRHAGVPAWRHYAMFLAVSAYRRLIWRAAR
jgi:hypothetical protein